MGAAAAAAGDAMTRGSHALSRWVAALIIAASSSCGPPGRDLPCTDQIAEGDLLHIELVAPYAPVDGGVWAGRDFNGYGAIPSCVGIDSLAIGATFDAKIQGSHENMLCTQFGFVPQWDAPQWIDASLPENLIGGGGAGSSEVAASTGPVMAPAGCLGRYGIALIALSGDVFASPSTVTPYGTFVTRSFGTMAPDACGPDFTGNLSPGGGTYCGDMYLVRVTR